MTRWILSLDLPAKREGGYVFYDRERDAMFSIGSIIFDPEQEEAADFRTLATLLDHLSPDLVILEHPFLYSIAGFVGAVKLWCSLRRIPWWMVTANTAKKACLGRGQASKHEVYAWAMPHSVLQELCRAHPLTQHEADALLYLETWKITHQERR